MLVMLWECYVMLDIAIFWAMLDYVTVQKLALLASWANILVSNQALLQIFREL
jgi:hypothetical protein